MQLIILLTLVLFVLLYVLNRVLRERQALAAHRDHLAAELDVIKMAVEPMCRHIGPNGKGGGVFKRISEIREITETIRNYQPELFRQEPGLIHGLRATDEFLCSLLDAAMPKGTNEWCDSQRERWEASWEQNGITSRIYTYARQEPENMD